VTGLHSVSLFAGVGGFDCALERVGIPTVAAVEIDKQARGVLADRFPNATLFDDVQKVTADDLRAAGAVPARTILTGGFPCQDVSVAGKRAGLAGARSGLFWHAARIVEELQPAWFIIENTPGLLSSNGGRDMGTVLGSLANLGYGIAYRVLDAQYFGVAQARRRVFIVGRLGDNGSTPCEVLFEREGGERDSGPSWPQGSQAATRHGDGAVRTLAYRKSKRAQTALDDETWVLDYKTNTITVFDSGDTRATTLIVERGPRPDVCMNCGNDAPTDGAEFCMECLEFAGVEPEPDVVRRLTPLEFERLQGFPDGWTATSYGKAQADSPRYKQMGNAVAVPVVAWIARRIILAAA